MQISPKTIQDLTVKGESIERIYGNYKNNKYLVNRRYQRKLVWTLKEKCSFIDSIIRGYPVPIILLAERRSEEWSFFEIIDGMQRLNAIMGFIENEYSVNGNYFDLNTMADSKKLLDEKSLTQKEPALSRDTCIQIASYTLPLSIYEYSIDNQIDEVFRRINSGGKKLSRQELRIAGSTGHFAQAVRKISAQIRGDVSSSDELLLNDMKKISITNRELSSYGIDVDDVFWIKHGVLTKDQVRESRDEEIIADILAYTLFDAPPTSRSEYLDDYFGFGEGEASKRRFDEIELAVQKYTVESIITDFQRVLDELKRPLANTGKTLGQLLFGIQPTRAPRYFQAIFLALHKLIVDDNKEIFDYEKFFNILEGSGEYINIPEGARWKSTDREKVVNGVVGLLSPVFRDATTYDPAQVRWITQLENILTQSFTEQAAYDFKQGFCRLDGKNSIDEDAFDKILKTLAGIANLKKGLKGYVLVGIADTEIDANRVTHLYPKVQPRKFERFFITGVEHEATAENKSLDDFFHLIVNKIKTSDLSEPLRDYVVRNIKLVKYYEKVVFILEALAQQDPSHLNGRYFVRHGNQLAEIQPQNFAEFFRRFHAGS